MRIPQTRIGLLLAVLLIAGCDMTFGPMYYVSDKSLIYPTNGEQIYFTGRDKDGRQVIYQGGNMHARMHQVSCADCHGLQREGGRRMYPSFWLVAPSLTSDSLFGEHHDGHNDHMAYTRDSLKQAITSGIDQSGKKMNSTMPRWIMSEADMDDLVDYLSEDLLIPSAK
ncbi:c-type cytochrome [Vibrio fluvialis]|nr:cytochrome c [Vibrio fluvialis]